MTRLLKRIPWLTRIILMKKVKVMMMIALTPPAMTMTNLQSIWMVRMKIKSTLFCSRSKIKRSFLKNKRRRASTWQILLTIRWLTYWECVKDLKLQSLKVLRTKWSHSVKTPQIKKPWFWTWTRPCSMLNSSHRVRNWRMMIVILYAIWRLRVQDQIQ